jgi:hypothetical protein
MSISAREAVEELREDLEYCLKAKNESMVKAGILNLDLAKDLCRLVLLKLPKNFEDSRALFRVFFERISHPQVTRRRYPHNPIVFSNIFMAITKSKVRLNVFRTILTKICQEYFHYEALFAVLCHVLHHPVYFNYQSERFFILKSMIVTRIEQRRQFPPKPDSVLTHICEESLNMIIEMMFKKHGIKDREETRRAMNSELRYGFNAYWNKKNSERIRPIFEADPNFFEKFEPALKRFFSRENRTAEKEKNWLSFLRSSIPDFWKALRENKVCDKAKFWILYWYVRHMEQKISSPPEKETFSELMTRLCKSDQMSFPFREPPKLFLNNDGDFRVLALRWGIVPSIDLTEILHRLHIKSGYGPDPSQCVLAAFVRRKLSLPLQGNKLICKGLFDVFIRPINLNFFSEYMRVGYGCHSKISMLRSKYALEKQNPFLRKYLSRCVDSKYLLQLKNMQFWIVFIQKIKKMLYLHYRTRT